MSEGVRADQEPGFWNEWQPPRSEVGRAIQYPIDKPCWPGRVVNAYLRDTRSRTTRKDDRRG